jgi:hypothetical protein
MMAQPFDMPCAVDVACVLPAEVQALRELDMAVCRVLDAFPGSRAIVLAQSPATEWRRWLASRIEGPS